MAPKAGPAGLKDGMFRLRLFTSSGNLGAVSLTLMLSPHSNLL